MTADHEGHVRTPQEVAAWWWLAHYVHATVRGLAVAAVAGASGMLAAVLDVWPIVAVMAVVDGVAFPYIWLSLRGWKRHAERGPLP
jgi:hypothetical protein